MKINIILNILVALFINLSAINVYASNSTDKDAQIKIRCNRENNTIKLRWSTTNANHWKLTNKKGFRLERYTFKRNGTYLDSPEKTIIADSIKALPLPLWSTRILRMYRKI